MVLLFDIRSAIVFHIDHHIKLKQTTTIFLLYRNTKYLLNSLYSLNRDSSVFFCFCDLTTWVLSHDQMSNIFGNIFTVFCS